MARLPTKTAKATNVARLARRAKYWKSFLDWIDSHSDSRWVFRGLGDANFQMIPGVGRGGYSVAKERTIFEVFERRSAEFVDLKKLTAWDRLALAQHHGLPTRLLDWTTNPLVAAFFGVTAPPGYIDVKIIRPSGRASTTTYKALPEAHTVDARIVAFKVTTSIVVDVKSSRDPFSHPKIGFVLPSAITTRIVSQGGIFSIHPNPSAPWSLPLANAANIFDVPGDLRSFFQQRLFYLGIENQRIMGGLDGICSRINWQYKSSIGLGAVR